MLTACRVITGHTADRHQCRPHGVLHSTLHGVRGYNRRSPGQGSLGCPRVHWSSTACRAAAAAQPDSQRPSQPDEGPEDAAELENYDPFTRVLGETLFALESSAGKGEAGDDAFDEDEYEGDHTFGNYDEVYLRGIPDAMLLDLSNVLDGIPSTEVRSAPTPPRAVACARLHSRLYCVTAAFARRAWNGMRRSVRGHEGTNTQPPRLLSLAAPRPCARGLLHPSISLLRMVHRCIVCLCMRVCAFACLRRPAQAPRGRRASASTAPARCQTPHSPAQHAATAHRTTSNCWVTPRRGCRRTASSSSSSSSSSSPRGSDHCPPGGLCWWPATSECCCTEPHWRRTRNGR